MTSFSLNALTYWRNTLADAARIEIKIADFTNLENLAVDYAVGSVASLTATELIDKEEKKRNKAVGIDDSNHPDWELIDQVQILISPFSVSPVPEYAKLTGETGTFYPFWIKAVLYRTGKLNVDEDTFPYIPRNYLEPQVNEDVNFIFSEVSKIDFAFSKPFTEDTWQQYWSYILDTFQLVTDLPLEKYSIENYTTRIQNTIVVNSLLSNAADSIIQLYDYLKNDSSELPLLFENLCCKTYNHLKPLLAVEDFENASLTHLGQMGYEFPLSISQRKSLYHFNTLKKGEILAVNGPPGTGKTTLIQSIVANEVVQSAIEGKDPRIILACSTNNQAVTNITDSFASVKSKQGTLYQRWVPGINSFALYLVAMRKIVAENIPYYKSQKKGITIQIESDEFIREAREMYIINFLSYTGKENLSIEDSIEYFRSELTLRSDNLNKGIALWKSYKKVPERVKKLDYVSDDLLNGLIVNVDVLNSLEIHVKNLEVQVNNYIDKESIWIKLFSWLRFVKEKRAGRLKQLFRDCLLGIDTIDFYQLKSVHSFFDEKLELVNNIRQLNTQWVNWKTANEVIGNPPVSDHDFKTAEQNKSPFYYDELEKAIKNEMFYLAVHYWEGRWILETEEAQREKRLNKNNKTEAAMRWQRYAMLLPCFVSTFYMAPKFISYSKFLREAKPYDIYERPPLTEFVDLLIVDEAGQVSPEVGAATFALAKRALVVGDTLQIEPVCNVPKKVDYANLKRFELIDSENDDETIDELHTKGFLSSSSSIMMLAQKASDYQLNSKSERGMLLIEHRRCFDEIISYCNKLAYHGLLEPKKGKSKNALFPPMQFISVTGESEKVNSSRCNESEADEIASWLKEYSAQIVNHYQTKEISTAKNENRTPKKLKLKDIVGIITPFTGQKWMLQATLQNKGIDINGLTIGTVHSFQGAEREIILFSPVYGHNNKGSNYFFDVGVNMLNVAVSRAKESFIVFGSEVIFNRSESNTPSSILYQHILKLNKAKMQST